MSQTSLPIDLISLCRSYECLSIFEKSRKTDGEVEALTKANVQNINSSLELSIPTPAYVILSKLMF